PGIVIMFFRTPASIVIPVLVLLWLLLLLVGVLIVLGGTGIFSQFAHTRLDFINKAHVFVILHHSRFHLGELQHHSLPDGAGPQVQIGQVFDSYSRQRERKAEGKEG